MHFEFITTVSQRDLLYYTLLFLLELGLLKILGLDCLASFFFIMGTSFCLSYTIVLEHIHYHPFQSSSVLHICLWSSDQMSVALWWAHLVWASCILYAFDHYLHWSKAMACTAALGASAATWTIALVIFACLSCHYSLLVCLFGNCLCMLYNFESALMRLPCFHSSFCWDHASFESAYHLTTYVEQFCLPSRDFYSWQHVVFLALLKITLVFAYMHIYCYYENHIYIYI